MTRDRSPAKGGPLLLVTVGSDHHPFDRLISWTNDYVSRPTTLPLRYFCQYGTAQPPRHGLHEAFVDHDRLLALIEQATVVVSHGGPCTAVEALRCGHLPIVVPRESSIGEVVDDHQQVFCDFLGSRGEAIVIRSQRQLNAVLDRVLAGPDELVAPRTIAYDHQQAQAVQRFSQLVETCRVRRRGRLLRRLRR